MSFVIITGVSSTACRWDISNTQLQVCEMFIFAKNYSRGETPDSGVKGPQVPGKTPPMQFQRNISDLKYLFQ